MPSDFGYINARVRGLKAKLLGDEFYNDALGGSDFRAFLSSFAQTSYSREFDEAQARYGGELRTVDEALARNFYTTTRTLLNVSDGLPERLLKLLLLRYDLGNLKTIARAKSAGRGADEVQAGLLPAGELKPAVLDSIAQASDLPAAAQAVAVTGHPLGPAFTRAVARYSSDGDLYELELSLDRAYYEALSEEVDKGGFPDDFKRYIQREVDATNIRTALKLRGSGDGADAPAQVEAVFIKGGKEVRRTTFDALLSGDTQGLSSTTFAEVAETDNLSRAEEALRGGLDRQARKLALRDPLGVGVVLNYLRLKETETARLRLLARGKFYGVPRGQLEQELGRA
ncbi:MAG: V-type ATP synthase subunit C [uncultured Truepera sp.]|uniref:V-type ATP synthase subunit C n=1 Tax=uncultured Truepera sp. TaxID=543023 RepID=A0A6J4V3M3_9DEIN|nr:MAG: V-type ATP synthase subunit C [uncultured Truepera sp.]